MKATAEVQAAARKVSEENVRLRSLLGICGVDNGKIEEFLRSGGVTLVSQQYWDNEWNTRSGKEGRFVNQAYDCIPTPNEMSIRSSTVLQTVEPLTAAQSVVAGKPPQDALDASEVLLPMPAASSNNPPSNTLVDIDHAGTPDQHRVDKDSVSSDLGLSSSKSDDTCRSVDGHDQMQWSGARNEISCLAAAEIIAGMRGHDNPEGILPELGCGSSKKCMVKSMAIFQIMDQ